MTLNDTNFKKVTFVVKKQKLA